MKVSVVFVAIPWLCMPVLGWGYVERYLPLDNKELSLRFPQRVVRSVFDSDMRVRVGTTTIQFVETSIEIRFSGVDVLGKPWTVTADALPGGGL